MTYSPAGLPLSDLFTLLQQDHFHHHAGYRGREDKARRRTCPRTSLSGRGDVERDDGHDASDDDAAWPV